MRKAPFCVALLFMQAAGAADSEWQRVADRGGVLVYVRPVPGSDVKEVRARGTVPAPADVPSSRQLMPPRGAGRLRPGGGDSACFYMATTPPLIARRDYCIRMTQRRQPDGVCESAWVVDEAGCPPPGKRMVRIQHNT